MQGRTRRRDERDDDPRRVDDVDGRNRRARDGERDPRSSEEEANPPAPPGWIRMIFSKRVPRFVAARLRRIPKAPASRAVVRVSIFARVEERSNERRDFLVPVLFRHLVSSLLSRVCGERDGERAERSDSRGDARHRDRRRVFRSSVRGGGDERSDARARRRSEFERRLREPVQREHPPTQRDAVRKHPGGSRAHEERRDPQRRGGRESRDEPARVPPAPPVPPQTRASPRERDAKTAFNGDASRNARTNRAAVNAHQNPDVSAAAAFASNAPRSIARVYIQLPYVTSVATERDTYAVNAASVQRAREPDGAATERTVVNSDPRATVPASASSLRRRGFETSVRRFVSIRGVSESLHLGGGGAVGPRRLRGGRSETMTRLPCGVFGRAGSNCRRAVAVAVVVRGGGGGARSFSSSSGGGAGKRALRREREAGEGGRRKVEPRAGKARRGRYVGDRGEDGGEAEGAPRS